MCHVLTPEFWFYSMTVTTLITLSNCHMCVQYLGIHTLGAMGNFDFQFFFLISLFDTSLCFVVQYLLKCPPKNHEVNFFRRNYNLAHPQYILGPALCVVD